MTYDIPAADNRTNVYLRWGHRVGSSGAFAYSGWNIDDIEFQGTPVQKLILSLPVAAAEGDGSVTGTIGVSPISSNNVVVSLSSSDTSEVTVPASCDRTGRPE